VRPIIAYTRSEGAAWSG